MTDDFVTTGIVLGANSSAIATAMLLQRDRRAAALSALAMSVFGILFVILTVILLFVGMFRVWLGCEEVVVVWRRVSTPRVGRYRAAWRF